MGFTRLYAGLLLALLLSGAAGAQTVRRAAPPPTTPSVGSIRGRVTTPNGRPVNEAIKVTLKVMGGDQAVVYTDQQGQFQFDGLGQGSYTLEAEADRERRFEPAVERVQVDRDAPTVVTLTLRERPPAGAEAERAPGVVSAGELDRNVPPKAAEEFERASRAAREGKPAEAVAHLEKAVALHPEYLKARNDLGTQLLALGRLEEAETHLREAVRIDARAFNPRLNLLIVLVERQRLLGRLGRLGGPAALDAASPAARLYAGHAHLGLEDSERAAAEFAAAYRLGGAPYAVAQFHLGQLYLDRGERALALKAFETYLRDMPDAANAEQVKRVIGVLR